MVQFIIGIIMILIGILGGYVAQDGWKKMHHKDKNTQQDTIENVNIQTTTTGDNSPIIGRDYIAGNQTGKNGPSLEDVESVMRKVFQENADSLHMKYGSRYAVAAITPDGSIVPKGDVPSGIKVRWETGHVTHMSSKLVKILVPEIIVNTEHMKRGHIAGNTIRLPKTVGAKTSLISAADFSVVIEVIGIDQNLVVIGLGMTPN